MGIKEEGKKEGRNWPSMRGRIEGCEEMMTSLYGEERGRGTVEEQESSL